MDLHEEKPNLLPTIFVILGATGDLMRRKLAPALFQLYIEGNLPSMFQVVGFARDELSHEEFQKMVAGMVYARTPDAPLEKVEAFTRYIRYQQGMFEEKEGYQKLAMALGQKDGEWQVCANKLFYIAASPQFYEVLFRQLAQSKLTAPCSSEEGWTRVIVEKPFGKDLQTAQELDRLLGKLFKEEQIYRIDHYLGKETVQNILAFRFSNSFLQDSWSAKAIESIRFRLWEKAGIGNRGNFYDGIGALRDVGQNHILQLLALFCMESPGTFDADSVRKERAKVLRALPSLSAKEVQEYTVRGQYEGYTQETGVQKQSSTETYFSIKTFLNTSKWRDIPLYLEGGKNMPEDAVEVAITFRHPTPCLCPNPEQMHYQNMLYYRIQPKEGIHITFWVKKPGPDMVLEEKEFSFDYKAAFGDQVISDAYVRLLTSVIRGDQTLFVSTEEIMAEWRFVDPIIREWQENEKSLQIYKKQSQPQ